MKRIVKISCVVVLLLFALAGYNFSKAAKDNKQKPRLFGATYMTRNNPFFNILNESIKEVVEANGDYLIVRDPQQNQERQNQQILDMIEEGIEVLFLNPVNWETVKPALEACKEAGVGIINIDTVVKDTDFVLNIVETDNYQAGAECARDMVKRMRKAKIVILNNPMQTSITDRIKGFKDVIKDKEKYEIVAEIKGASEIEIAAEAMAEYLGINTDFDVVLGGNDPSAIGALSSLQQFKADENVKIYGIDGSPDFKAMLALGHVTATSAQSPKTIGRVAVENAYKYLAGQTLEKHIKLPTKLITKENLHEYEINGWQ